MNQDVEEGAMNLGEYSSWHSYPDSKAISHKMMVELFYDDVVVEEKIDGSQFSFGSFGPEPSDLKFKSKGAEIFVTTEGHASEKMFEKGVQSVIKRQYLLREGWTYRVEYVPKPKAVTLTYDRVPKDLFDGTDSYLIGYDVETSEGSFLNPTEKQAEFARIGLETTPCYWHARVESVDFLKAMLENVSVLGGQQIEGVAIKNYNRFGLDGKILFGKYVSKDFKELHGKTWAESNPGSGDIVQVIISDLRTPARWRKAEQHLREAGTLIEGPQSIPLLMREVREDIKKEQEGEIKDKLFKWAWAQIERGVTAGLPEWWKQKLLDDAAPEGHLPTGPDYADIGGYGLGGAQEPR